MNDSTFHAVLTGTSPFDSDDFTKAVAERFEAVKDTEAFAHRDHTHPDTSWGWCYDGNRTRPENLGWRTAQTAGYEKSLEEIAAGEYDAEIAAGFHEAASSEYFYRFEKDWG